MNVDRSAIEESFDRATVRSVSKLLLTAASLVFVLYLLTLLPGIDRIVPQTPVTFAALVGVVATVTMVALLLYLAPKFASLTRMALDGPKSVVENVSSVVFWLVVLAAVLVAHGGLVGAAEPFLDGAMWIYDVSFLLLALPAVAFVAARLYASVEPGADLLANRFVDAGATETPEGNASVAPGEREDASVADEEEDASVADEEEGASVADEEEGASADSDERGGESPNSGDWA